MPAPIFAASLASAMLAELSPHIPSEVTLLLSEDATMVEGVDVGLLIDRLPYRPLGIETAAQHVVSAIQDAVIRHTTDPWPFKRVGRHSSDAIPYPNPEVVDDSLLLRFDNCLQVRPIDLAALPGYDEYRDSHPPLPPDVATGQTFPIVGYLALPGARTVPRARRGCPLTFKIRPRVKHPRTVAFRVDCFGFQSCSVKHVTLTLRKRHGTVIARGHGRRARLTNLTLRLS